MIICIYLVDSQNRWLLDTSISIMYKIGNFKGENKKFRIVFLINPWNFNVFPSIPNHLILPIRDRQYTLISSNSACFTKVLRTYERVFSFLFFLLVQGNEWSVTSYIRIYHIMYHIFRTTSYKPIYMYVV